MAVALMGASQRVTLKGKNFILNDQEFYPVSTNFSVIYAYPNSVTDPSAEDLIFSINDSWGETGDFDCSNQEQCSLDLRAAFDKCIEMGFNSIRLVGVAPIYKHAIDLGPVERRFELEASRLPNTHQRSRIRIEGPDFNDPVSLKYFEMLREILDIADDASLKVILLCVEPSRKDTATGSWQMYPAFDQQAVTEYAQYLSRLAQEVGDHPALMALDLFNEPHYNKMEYQQWDDYPPNVHDKWRKEDVCSFTTQWYDAIKTYAPDLLVTLGGLGLPEIEVWDVASLKIDFYSLHIYPGGGDFLGLVSSFPDHLLRYKNELHWFGQVCPMPWIIGETGFSANDRYDQQPHAGNQPEYHEWPWMHGTEAEQAIFLEQSLNTARACGASGWSWWVFQEFRWYDVTMPDSIANFPPSALQQNYYGLLHLGETGMPWGVDKEAVAAVLDYTPEPMPDPPGDEPPNYYNWHNLPGPVTYDGTIVDQHQQPIKNAQAWFWQRSIDDLDQFGTPYPSEYETFHPSVTDGSGYFYLNTEPTGIGYEPPTILHMVLTSVGAKDISIGSWTGTPIPAAGHTHDLTVHPFQITDNVSGIDIVSTSDAPFEEFIAWMDLSVETSTFQGIPEPGATLVEFKARNSITAKPSFHAQPGSHVHIYIDSPFPDCDDPSYKILPASETDAGSQTDLPAAELRSLHLKFLNEPSKRFRVNPNPFNQLLKVEFDDFSHAELTLFDGVGRHIGTWHADKTINILDIGSLAPGQYTLRITQGEFCETHQLMKQP